MHWLSPGPRKREPEVTSSRRYCTDQHNVAFSSGQSALNSSYLTLHPAASTSGGGSSNHSSNGSGFLSASFKMSWAERRFPFMHANNRTAELQQYANRDVEENKILCANLRKLNSLRRRWFVLYSTTTLPADKTGSNGDPVVLPAHLEYHDSEAKWRAGEIPKRVIDLKSCFNICRKKDSKDAINRFVIAIYTLDNCLSILFEEEEDLKMWLDHLLSLQKGRSRDGKIPRPNYEHMWQVHVRHFKPEDPLNTFTMSGDFRLCVTSEELRFFEIGSEKPITFSKVSIRNSRSIERLKTVQIDMGNRTPSGRGQLIMRCDDKDIAMHINKVILEALASASSKPMTRLDAIQVHSDLHHHHRQYPSSSSKIDYRPRSESCSKIDKVSSGSSSAGGKAVASTHHHPHLGHSQRTEHLTKIPYSHGSGSRSRTVSEGNNQQDLRKAGRGHYTGSPMSPSPGSYVSSESAGSSNSIDDADSVPDRRQFNVAETPKTIYEESSTESMVDPKNQAVNLPLPPGLADSPPPAPTSSGSKAAPKLDLYSRTMSDCVQYTAVEVPPKKSPNLPPPNGAAAHSLPYATLAHQDPYIVMTPTSDLTSPVSSEAKSLSSSSAAVPVPTSAATAIEKVIASEGSAYEIMSPIAPSKVVQPPPAAAVPPSVANSSVDERSPYEMMSPVDPLRTGMPSEISPYEMMSPVNIDPEQLDDAHLPSPTPLSAIEERLGGAAPNTPLHLRSGSETSGGARPKSKRSSFCSETDGRWSPLTTQWDLEHSVIGYDSDQPPTPPPGSVFSTQQHPDYVPLDYSQTPAATCTSRTSANAIPIPRKSASANASGGGGGSNSSSLVSGTPNSSSMSRCQASDTTMYSQGPLKAYPMGPQQQGSMPSTSAMPPPAPSSSSTSNRSRTSSFSTPFIRIPGSGLGAGGSGSKSSLKDSGRGLSPSQSSSSSVLTSHSPNLLTRWFRSRTGSVPSKPQDSRRRRHRTQSEGEKDSPENQEAVHHQQHQSPAKGSAS